MTMRDKIARRIMLHDLQLLHDFGVDGDIYRKDPECRDAAYIEADAIHADLPDPAAADKMAFRFSSLLANIDPDGTKFEADRAAIAEYHATKETT